MAEQLPELTGLYDGMQAFDGGQDSFVLPLNLNENEYAAAENVMCRGGIVQTRPDSKSLMTCPCSTFAQGCTMFIAGNGITYLVFASYGRIYVSPKPFKTYTLLPNIQFNPQSTFIAWAVCQQSTDYDPAGNIIYLDTPKPVLIMQDGATRAAMWDGVMDGHLNPTWSGTPNATKQGLDETVIGLWMAWSNNRLWVANGNTIKASDIGNPLKFTECQFISEVRAFYLPHDCVGITKTPDQTGIICFTEYEGVFIQSSVQDRTQWASLASGQMQNTMLPHVGCTSARSIVTQYGLLWWFSPMGLINLNAALRQNLSSKMEAMDFEMFNSKYYIGGATMDGICGVAHENFMLESVPSGDSKNRHTWALDQNPAGKPRVVENIYGFEFTNAWASTWTGWRPVEWCKGIVDGVERVFFQSYDYDGAVRIWEAFTGNTGRDNGVPITSWVMCKDHNFKSVDRKKFRWAEFSLRDLIGDVSLMVAYAGRRGTYTPIFTGDLCATEGQVYYNSIYGSGSYGGKLLTGNRAQTRYFRTGDTVPPDTCNTCGIESTDPNNEDTQFSLMFLWSGKVGVEWYRMMSMEDPREEGGGTGCIVEDCPRSLNDDGCSAKSMFVATSPFTDFNATETCTISSSTKSFVATHSASSVISQRAAEYTAYAMAYQDVVWQAGLSQ